MQNRFPGITLEFRPLLNSGMLADSCKGTLILIDSEQKESEQAKAIFHEVFHLLLCAAGIEEPGQHREETIDKMAEACARACPGVVALVKGKALPVEESEAPSHVGRGVSEMTMDELDELQHEINNERHFRAAPSGERRGGCFYPSGCDDEPKCNSLGLCHYKHARSSETRRDGHSALRVKNGTLEKFDPHPESAPSSIAHRSAYEPLTPERIEQIRIGLRALGNKVRDYREIDTLCAMAENCLLYAQEIQRLRGDALPTKTLRTSAQEVYDNWNLHLEAKERPDFRKQLARIEMCPRCTCWACMEIRARTTDVPAS